MNCCVQMQTTTKTTEKLSTGCQMLAYNKFLLAKCESDIAVKNLTSDTVD